MGEEFVQKQLRINRIDKVKGISIILMVMGHCSFPASDWIYLFHMAVFFMASGYFWKDSNAINTTTVRKYILRKLKNLYVPYVLSGITFILLTNLFIRLNIYTDNPQFYELTGGELIKCMDCREIISKILLCVLFVGGSQLGGALWFLNSLFIVSVGHCILIYLIRRAGLYQYKRYLICIIFGVCALIAWGVGYGVEVTPSASINIAFAIYMTYLLGIWIKTVEMESMYKLGVGASTFFVLCLFNRFGSVSLNIGQITDPFFLVIVSLSGWITINCISNIVPDRIGKILEYIGKNTLPILILHFLCFKIVTYLIIVLTKRNILLLASFPVLYGISDFMWIPYTFAGIAVPLGVNALYQKIKIRIIGRMQNQRGKYEETQKSVSQRKE